MNNVMIRIFVSVVFFCGAVAAEESESVLVSDRFSVGHHAKSMVVDDRIACIGSANLSPRSLTLNSEIAVFIEDEVFAKELRQNIERDTRPQNSWAAGPRSLRGARMNRFIEKTTRYLPLDSWPVSSTASFEGGQPVGVLPRVKFGSRKHFKFNVYKLLGPLMRPLL